MIQYNSQRLAQTNFGIAYLIILCLFFAQIHSVVLEKGQNISMQMQAGIRKSIKDSSANCTSTDRSCFSQIVGLKIQNLYGKSWNVHLLEKTTTLIKGMQYSHDKWISLINEGDPAYSYFIFKPIDCSKPLSKLNIRNSHLLQKQFLASYQPKNNQKNVQIRVNQQKEYWGNSMTDNLKVKVKNLMDQAYKASQVLQQNAHFIQNKLGPGRWQVIIWNTPSFDYMDTCMYASYFGLLVGVSRGTSAVWSYYIGRMSLI